MCPFEDSEFNPVGGMPSRALYDHRGKSSLKFPLLSRKSRKIYQCPVAIRTEPNTKASDGFTQELLTTE